MLKTVSGTVRFNRNITSFTLSGDPGCDGYNVEAIMVLESILRRPADFHILLGDLVPTGKERWFRQFAAIVNRNAAAPVYCLAGNHDLPDYETACGDRNYCLRADNALIIVLDNSSRSFSDAAMACLTRALEEEGDAPDIFVAFHIPPPNPYIPNNFSQEEWEKLRGVLLPFRDRVRYLFAGHVHSGFEYELDGFRVVVTGGGGSRLDNVKNTFFPVNRHHLLVMNHKDGQWTLDCEPVELEEGLEHYGEEPDGEKTLAALLETFSEEAKAYRRYLLFAEQALRENRPNLAKLFRAAADSEFHHSRNMLLAAGGIGASPENIDTSIRLEGAEWRETYPALLARSEDMPSRRVGNSYETAIHAEKTHHQLFTRAKAALTSGHSDIAPKNYFTCMRCGYTHEGDQPPALCPACGTDNFRFAEVQ